MVSEARAKATTKYFKTHLRQFILRCHNEYDKDIIDYLESCGNINGTIKRLIREDIEHNRKAE